MFNINGPGFAGLYAGDLIKFRDSRDPDLCHDATVLRLLVFADHVQVRYTSSGYTVDAHNFVRVVRRGKRHLEADRELDSFNACHPAD
jgi:hypothetical protein